MFPLIQVGGRSSTTRCSDCPTGSFSNKEQSQECTKCPYGQYQDKKGQTSCKKCPEGHFSHEADKGCFPLRACNESDYRVVPDPVSKCFKEGNKIVRKQTSAIPHWPGTCLCQFLLFLSNEKLKLINVDVCKLNRVTQKDVAS